MTDSTNGGIFGLGLLSGLAGGQSGIGGLGGGMLMGNLVMPEIAVRLKGPDGKEASGHVRISGKLGLLATEGNTLGEIVDEVGVTQFKANFRRGNITIAVTNAYSYTQVPLADKTITQLHIMKEVIEIEMVRA